MSQHFKLSKRHLSCKEKRRPRSEADACLSVCLRAEPWATSPDHSWLSVSSFLLTHRWQQRRKQQAGQGVEIRSRVYQPHTACAKCLCSCAVLLWNGPMPFAGWRRWKRRWSARLFEWTGRRKRRSKQNKPFMKLWSTDWRLLQQTGERPHQCIQHTLEVKNKSLKLLTNSRNSNRWGICYICYIYVIFLVATPINSKDVASLLQFPTTSSLLSYRRV